MQGKIGKHVDHAFRVGKRYLFHADLAPQAGNFRQAFFLLRVCLQNRREHAQPRGHIAQRQRHARHHRAQPRRRAIGGNKTHVIRRRHFHARRPQINQQHGSQRDRLQQHALKPQEKRTTVGVFHLPVKALPPLAKRRFFPAGQLQFAYPPNDGVQQSAIAVALLHHRGHAADLASEHSKGEKRLKHYDRQRQNAQPHAPAHDLQRIRPEEQNVRHPRKKKFHKDDTQRLHIVQFRRLFAGALLAEKGRWHAQQALDQRRLRLCGHIYPQVRYAQLPDG